MPFHSILVPMNTPLRVGFVGCGFIAGVHAKALRQIPQVELAAVADTDGARRTAFAAQYQIQASFASFPAMLDAARLDAIYFCIPPFAHDGEVERAAARGLNLFLEKPIALNAAHAARMVAAIEGANVKSQVGFHFRFLKSVRRIRQLLESGEAGRPTLFSGRYWTNMDGAPWWRDRNQSGGQVFEQVIHIYDLARHLCGDVEVAQGVLRNLCHQNRADYSIEDTSIGTLQFKNGALGVITGSNCAVPIHFFGDFRLVCEKMTLDYSCTGQNWVTPDAARLYRSNGDIEALVEDEDPYLLESKDFIAAIRENRATATPARAGLEAIQLIETILN